MNQDPAINPYEDTPEEKSFGELLSSMNAYNSRFNSFIEVRHSENDEENELILEASPDTQKHISEEKIKQSFLEIKQRLAPLAERTGLGLDEQYSGAANQVNENDEVQATTTWSKLEVVVLNVKTFVDFLHNLKVENISGDAVVNFQEVLTGLLEQVRRMYGLNQTIKDYQIEIISGLVDISDALGKFKQINNEKIQITIDEFSRYAVFVKEGTFEDRLVIEHSNLLDESEDTQYVLGPKTWMLEIGRVAGNGVFEVFEYRWEKAIDTLIDIAEHPKSNLLYLQLRGHLIECIEKSKAHVDGVTTMLDEDASKEAYLDFISEKLEFLKSI